jgi:thymidylate synthase
MNNLDKRYTDLLQDILINGVVKSDRTGTGTISVFGRQIRHRMSDGFPLLTTKKMPFKTIVTELLWFLKGDTNIKYLVDNGCHIWDGDAYKNYLKWDGNNPLTIEEFIEKIKTDSDFAGVYGDLGPIYGAQWRSWCGYEKIPVGWNHGSPITFKEVPKCDQIQNLINDLKTNPDSRRLMVNAWNVGELDQMVLPPCHYGFQVYTRELSLEERNKSMGEDYAYRGVFSGPIARQEELDKYKKLFDEQNRPTRAISLMWNQRSVDTFLGLPFNIASYGLLLEIIAKAVNMVPDELIGNLGDVHLYSNHVEQAKEQIGREFDELERMELGIKKGLWKEFQFGNIHLTCDEHNIPKQTREPYPLPTLKHMKTEAFYKSLSEDVSLVTHLDNTDFEMVNYQSHPSIKAPLSN